MVRYLLICLFLLLSGCSSTLILPQSQAGSQIDMAGQRISQTTKGVHLSVKLHDVSVRPSPVEQNYSSFWVEVSNQRNVLLPLSYQDFSLLDDQGRQYLPVNPEKLLERLTDYVAYLVPYPYVGFYYLEDSLRSQADTQFRSESNYFASRRPEYVTTEALPEAAVLPAAKLSGAIYFPVELRSLNSFRVRYQAGALPGQKSFQINLPFTVEKK